MVEIKRGEKIAPCSCFKQISKGRTRRNLQADPRESRVRRADGWMDGMPPRGLGTFETALGTQNTNGTTSWRVSTLVSVERKLA
jgi:hypothetical protein